MSHFRERLEAFQPRNGNGSRSQVKETNTPIGAELTNLLRLELLQRQGEQLQRPSDHLQKLMEARERKVEEDNSYIFKRFVSHNPPVHNGTPNPKTFED